MWLWMGSAAAQVPLPAPSQPAEDSIVVPDLSNGQKSGWTMFGTTCPGFTPMTQQWIFDVPASIPTNVRAIGLRRVDLPDSPSSATPAFSVTGEVWMAHSTVAPTSVGYRYASHRGADYRRVMTSRTLNFASEQWRADGTYPFSFRFPLDFPFTFRSGSAGLVELALTNTTLCINQTNPRVCRVETYNPVRPVGYFSNMVTSIGQGCSPTGSTFLPATIVAINPVLAVGQQGAWIFWNSGSGNPQAQTLYCVGTSETSWLGTSLPFSLGPLGAGGCSLYTSIEWAVPPLLASAFFQTAVVSAPLNSGLVGAHVYVQAVRLHPSFNALGVLTTNALKFRILGYVDSRMAGTTWSANQIFGPGIVESAGLGGAVLLLDGR